MLRTPDPIRACALGASAGEMFTAEGGNRVCRVSTNGNPLSLPAH